MAQNIDYGNRNTFSALVGKLYNKVVRRSEIKTVALTGSYNDLADKPSVPDGNLYVKKAGDTMTGRLTVKQGTVVHGLSGGGGTAGYFHVCQLKITGAYKNQYMIFHMVGRGRFGTLYMAFNSVNNTDPALGIFSCSGDTEWYINKSAVSTWDLYVAKSEPYDDAEVTMLEKGTYGDPIQITWKDATVASLPTGSRKADSVEIKVNITGNASYATQLYGTLTNPASETTYYIPFHAGYGSGNKNVLHNDGVRYATTEGTTSAAGKGMLILGNTVASGTAGNKIGVLKIHGTGSFYWTISGYKAGEANYSLKLPKSSGCLVAVPTDGTAVGSANVPVYINANGVATAITSYSGTANNANNIKTENTNPSVETKFRIPFVADANGSTSASVNVNDGLILSTRQGSISAYGYSVLIIGNNIASGTDGNKFGGLIIYDGKSHRWYIDGGKVAGSDYVLTLPNSNGCLVAVPTDGQAVGNASTPVYVNANGQVVACTDIGGGSGDGYASKAVYADNHISLGRSATATSDDNAAGVSSGTAYAVGEGSICFGNSGGTGGDMFASGKNSVAVGEGCQAAGDFSVAVGNGCRAKTNGISVGKSTAYGSGGIAVGFGGTTASGQDSIALGSYAQATGMGSVAIGYNSEANTDYALAFGRNSKAYEMYSVAFTESKCSGKYAMSFGLGVSVNNFAALAFGKYHAKMSSGGAANNTTGHVLLIGNGTSPSATKNALSLAYTGAMKLAGSLTQSTTADYAEYFEWRDENRDYEDRVGYFVTLEGDRIRIAGPEDEYLLGIVSGAPAVIANGDCDVWNGMELRDEFNRVLYERAPYLKTNPETGEEEQQYDEDGNMLYMGTRPVINPEYDPTQQYVSREDRPEWSPVGMLGVLPVRQDGSLKVNGYCTCGDGGIATSCARSPYNCYRVIEVVSEKVAKVVFR